MVSKKSQIENIPFFIKPGAKPRAKPGALVRYEAGNKSWHTRL